MSFLKKVFGPSRAEPPKELQRIDEPSVIVERMIRRVALDPAQAEKLIDAFKSSMEAAAQTRSVEQPGCVEKLPQSEVFLRLLSDALIDKKSTFNYPPEMAALPYNLNLGTNAVLAANHTSIADTLVLHALLDRIDPKLQERTVYIVSMLGQDYREPLISLYSGINRINVNSDISIQEAPVREAQRMREQNIKAVRDIAHLMREGGWLIVLHPEARASDGTLLIAREASGQIFEVMHRHSPKYSCMFPAYIRDADKIAPVEPTIQEIAEDVRRSKVSVTVGDRVELNELIPDMPMTQGYWYMTRVMDRVMGRIAQLMPPEKRGRYRDRT